MGQIGRGKSMKVQNMIGNAGAPVKNQFIISDNGSTVFQSYQTTIAKIENGQVYLDVNSWDYSKTTGRYRNLFLGEKKAETLKKIESGEYKLIDLNS